MNADPAAKKPLNDYLFEKTGGVVQTGPFVGMKLLAEKAWEDGGISTQLLGCYEQELHQHISAEIERLRFMKHPVIVNIGCAEGYYAVGLGWRLPRATIYAIDVIEEAFRIMQDAAKINGVENIAIKVHLDTVMAEPDLVLCDCEGYEVHYLNLEKYPALEHAMIIVECHDCDALSCTKVLTERFAGTHSIENIVESGRDPNKFELLQQMHSAYRWAAVSEGRPCIMNWLVMKPFQPRPPQ